MNKFYLFCYDENKTLKMFSVADPVDLNNQIELKHTIFEATGVCVKPRTPVLGLYINPNK